MTKKIFVYPIKLKLPHDGNPSAVSLPLMAALVEMNSELVLIDTGFPLNSELVDQLALLHFDPDDIELLPARLITIIFVIILMR